MMADTRKEPFRVVLADDHAVVRKGIREFLEEDPEIAGPGDVLDELAEVLAVLQHREDTAELLRHGELGLRHDVEEAVAEELLDRRRVEVAEDVQGPGAGAPDQREDRVVLHQWLHQRLHHRMHQWMQQQRLHQQGQGRANHGSG